ncbi:MAG: PDDEXK nuclease domain-containing protein [Bacteroidota bacterium]
MDKAYLNFLERIKDTIQVERTKAIQNVNRSLIALYWEIGKQIIESQQEHGWGKSIVEQLSNDLRKAYPGKTGFSPRNLWDMRRFFDTYKGDPNLRQLVAEIPWGHNLLIMQKAKSREERQYYLQASSQMGWSRGVLLNQIKAEAFQRQVQLPKQTNFEKTLPAHLAEQADETIKSSYNLEFLGISEPILELQLENKLLQKLQSFILELGYGFAFIGNQYPVALGNKTYRIDLLFYHRYLQCLVAIDLKIGEFEPEHAGKMNFYLELLDDKHKLPHENPAIGIILCAEKNHLEVEYALRSSSKPVGVAEYQLSTILPDELSGKIPSPEQLKKPLIKK